MYMCTTYVSGACGGQKKARDHLGLESGMELGTHIGSFARATGDFHCRAISPVSTKVSTTDGEEP